MLRRWCEPPVDTAFHFSTLVQQTLSLIAQYGAATALQLWQVLCSTGPFSNIDAIGFAEFLKALGAAKLIKQCHDTTLVLDVRGERLVNHYDFYAAFSTPDEYRLFDHGKILGTLPIIHPIVPATFMIYAGRRWLVISVDEKRRIIDLKAAAAGRVPQFWGGGFHVHSRIRAEMYSVFLSNDLPVYLNPCAQDLLHEARGSFARYQLSERALLCHGSDALLFHWSGDLEAETLRLMLIARGVRAVHRGIAIEIANSSYDAVAKVLSEIAVDEPPSADKLAQSVPVKVMEKHDRYLPPVLMDKEYAARFLNPTAASDLVRSLLPRIQRELETAEQRTP